MVCLVRRWKRRQDKVGRDPWWLLVQLPLIVLSSCPDNPICPSPLKCKWTRIADPAGIHPDVVATRPSQNKFELLRTGRPDVNFAMSEMMDRVNNLGLR